MRFNRPHLKHSSSLISYAIILAVLVMVASSIPAPLHAGPWEGEEVTKGGEVHMMNPATPIHKPITITPEKLWQVTGDDEDEEFFFGVLLQITTDSQGTIYLLDAQLHQVLIFNSQGEFVRTIGREGEGPGEFRRPSDLFLTQDGQVAVMQRMPGKIITMTPEGEPVGVYPVPETEDGGVQMFASGQLAGDNLVLTAQQFNRREDGFDVVASVFGVDGEGKKTATYIQMKDTNDFANMVVDEKKSVMSVLLWRAAMDGRVFISNNFDSYSLKIMNADGTLDRVIEREYEPRLRSEEEKERLGMRAMMRRGGRAQQLETRTSDNDRSIVRIFPRDDGSLWVLSSKGAYDVPEGVIATFDVYDHEGRFTHQVTINGEGSYRDDGFHIVKDRLYVVTGLISARRAMRGGGGDEEPEEEDDPKPMGVICYEIGPTVQSMK